MKNALIAPLAVAALASCAQMTASSSSAEQQCVNFARNEGLRVIRVDGIEAANVRLRLEDSLGRGFNATCTSVAAGQPRWAQPLPQNAVRG
ncbi:MAG TPA: hypothetical protein VM937_05600 [Burkholderiaceae bacterium]|nr:hypothetical protein [Burkholderiaceae bacterium]